MIETVHLKYFKQFEDQSFDLEDTMVLAGPNNTGKTTLLQAIATWHFAFREWEKKKGSSATGKRTGVALTRKELLSVPVQRFNLLWTDGRTALKKEEGGGRGAATPRIMEITLEGGRKANNPWQHTMEFRYANPEQIYVKPTTQVAPPEEISVVYVPPFSGIETEEKVHTREYQEWLIGQGKPGDIIRNLLVETSSGESLWSSLREDIKTMFNYYLLEPQYLGRPFILCEYLPGVPPSRGYGGLPRLELASAGSGFLQTLLLLSFFHARPSSVLLVDEPDAHLHVILQKHVYDHLRRVAAARQCQVIVATHSEVIIDNTSPSNIISFYGEPHRLVTNTGRDNTGQDNTGRERVREALKRLTSMDILLSRREKILYGEGNSDFNVLRAWASILDHPLKNWFSVSGPGPFYFPIKGREAKHARDHFFALGAVTREMRGVLLLDGDNRNLPEREISAPGLKIIRWRRYEIENYLVNYELIKRFIEERVGSLFLQPALEHMENEWPPAMLNSPLEDIDYLRNTPASKDILRKVFSSAQISMGKQEYYRLAEKMVRQEIHPEINEKLDEIYTHWEQ